MLPLIIHPDVVPEIVTAREWYRQTSHGLADEFSRCLAATIDEIRRNPRMYAEIEGGFRRANLHRFPYQVFYRVASSHVFVLGVHHSHIDPQTKVARSSSRDPR